MNATLQGLLTFAIVAVAFCYAGVKLMPKTWRSRLAATAAGLAIRIGLSDSTARRVESKLASGGACGSCDSCRACAAPAKEEGTETALATSVPSDFRRIPIHRV